MEESFFFQFFNFNRFFFLLIAAVIDEQTERVLNFVFMCSCQCLLNMNAVL